MRAVNEHDTYISCFLYCRYDRNPVLRECSQYRRGNDSTGQIICYWQDLSPGRTCHRPVVQAHRTGKQNRTNCRGKPGDQPPLTLRPLFPGRQSGFNRVYFPKPHRRAWLYTECLENQFFSSSGQTLV